MKKSVDVSIHYFDKETGLGITEGMNYLIENLPSLDAAIAVANTKLHELFGVGFSPEWESEWIDDFEFSHICYNWDRGFSMTIHEVDIDLAEKYSSIQ